MSLSYKLTPAADQDLVDIFVYTQNHWGKKQAIQYLNELEQGFLALAQGSNLGQARPEICEGYKAFYINKHIVFYRFYQKQLEIIRILHQRMDIIHHL